MCRPYLVPRSVWPLFLDLLYHQLWLLVSASFVCHALQSFKFRCIAISDYLLYRTIGWLCTLIFTPVVFGRLVFVIPVEFLVLGRNGIQKVGPICSHECPAEQAAAGRSTMPWFTKPLTLELRFGGW